MSAAKKAPSLKLIAAVRRDVAGFRRVADATNAPAGSPVRILIERLEKLLPTPAGTGPEVSL